MIQTMVLANRQSPEMAAFAALLQQGGVFSGLTHEECMECFFLYTSVAIHKRYDPQPRPEMFSEVSDGVTLRLLFPCALPSAALYGLLRCHVMTMLMTTWAA
jgi:hypothetical protein